MAGLCKWLAINEDSAVGTLYLGVNYMKLTKCYIAATSLMRRYADLLMIVVGIALLSAGLTEISHAQFSVSIGGGGGTSYTEAYYDDTMVRGAVGLIFKLIEGAFGALVMVVAGLAAIIAAAMGAYKASLGMLVVAVGAFILRALVSLFFGTNFYDVSGGVSVSVH